VSHQSLLGEVKKHIPFRVYGKGPVVDLFRELGHYVDKKTPLQVTDVFRWCGGGLPSVGRGEM
jgi:hypothetical protein